MRRYESSGPSKPSGPDHSKLHPDDFDPIHTRVYELLERGPASPQDLAEDDEITVSASAVRRRANDLLDADYLERMRDPYHPTSNLYYRPDCGDPLTVLGFNTVDESNVEADGGEDQ